MRLRLILFLPLAALITFFMLACTSSFVSALDRSLFAQPEGPTPPIRIQRFETECDALYREIHALSHAVTSCEAEPSCLGSPLLCPVVMDQEVEADYQRLRRALNERCEVPLALMDFAWGGPVGESPTCGVAHDWLEATTSGQTEPSRFFF